MPWPSKKTACGSGKMQVLAPGRLAMISGMHVYRIVRDTSHGRPSGVVMVRAAPQPANWATSNVRRDALRLVLSKSDAPWLIEQIEKSTLPSLARASVLAAIRELSGKNAYEVAIGVSISARILSLPKSRLR